MSEVKQFHLREGTLIEGKSLGCLNVYLASDYDQLKAELDRLRDVQILLNTERALVEQLEERIAELQKDADRYRWLEANSTYGIDYRQRPELTLPIYAPDHREGLDAAIDKAMKGEGDE